MAVCGFAALAPAQQAEPIVPLPGTRPLEMEGDLASELVDAVDKFLLRELELSVERRKKHWHRDTSSATAYVKSLEANRRRLMNVVGLRDPRVPCGALELVATTSQAALVGRGENFQVLAVRWPTVKGVYGEGLLLEPVHEGTRRRPLGDVVCIPDAAQTPEMLAGLVPGVPPEQHMARRLAESGYRVVVPALIDRANQFSVAGERRTQITHREMLYRPAFQMGRHLIGYELHKVLALVDWFSHEARGSDPVVAVVGYGEGGLLALYAGAIDTRIDAVGVSGYFDSRQDVWQEPLDRNVFALLDEFGDAEMAAMIAPRPLVVEAAKFPEATIPPGTGGGPGRIVTPPLETVEAELRRARGLLAGLKPTPPIELVVSDGGGGPFGSEAFLSAVIRFMSDSGKLAPLGSSPMHLRQNFDPNERLKRQYDEIELHTQLLLAESPYVRAEFMAKVERGGDLERFQESTRGYREYFRNEVIGSFNYKLLPLAARSRQIIDEPRYAGYEVVLDVFPGVFAYGIYLVPKGIAAGERRPVVVCQHGLEGRPQDLVAGDHRAYHDYAAKLAERGFITFSPQNLYIFGDRFRTLQRKANPLKKTLFSVMVPQHQQIVAWLAGRPEVDGERIGFYGLSYGGKSAMRIPALVDGYALSICSADFNEWIWKNASMRSPYSYTRTGEYEIFEFDLGSTFNYSEMAALICPRPFMVERGHRDGVAPDEAVAYEYAKVRLLYTDLGIPERTEIEYFDGPHTIQGVGTFAFLHKHLNWPQRQGAGGE